MKFETRRERELRRKRQKRSAILGMVFAILVVIGLGILLWNGKKNIEAKNVEYEKEISQIVNRNVQMNLMNTKNIYRLKSSSRKLLKISLVLCILMR